MELMTYSAIRRSLSPLLPQVRSGAKLRAEVSPDGEGITAFAQLTTGSAVPMWQPLSDPSGDNDLLWRIRGLAHTDRPSWMDFKFIVPSVECAVIIKALATQRDAETQLYTFVQQPIYFIERVSVYDTWPDINVAAYAGEFVTILAPLVRFKNGLPVEQMWDRALSLTVHSSGNIGSTGAF